MPLSIYIHMYVTLGHEPPALMPDCGCLCVLVCVANEAFLALAAAEYGLSSDVYR
jgi:hypothetical protein